MMIPNPTRKTTVNYSLDVVKQSVDDFTLLKPKYSIFEKHDVMNLYILQALEFLSFGVFIDISLSEISENKTEISIEVRRKIGGFDEPHEVSKAGNHIKTILIGIGELLSDPELGKNLLKKKNDDDAIQAEKIKENEMSNTQIIFSVLGGLAIGGLVLYFMFH